MKMTNNSYPQEFIDEIYQKGDIDSWDFAYFIGNVRFGETDEDDFGKTDIQALEDAIKLMEFFVKSGDFEIIKTMPSPHGSIKNVSYWANLDLAMIPYPTDLIAFKEEVTEIYNTEGRMAEPFCTKIWLHKKILGKKAPKIPPEISKIFEPYT